MKTKNLSLAISAILMAASVSTALAGTINRIRIPTAGINAPAVTAPTTPGNPTTPTEPTTPPVEVSDFVIELEGGSGAGKMVTYAPQGVEGDSEEVNFWVTNKGGTTKAFNPAFTISGNAANKLYFTDYDYPSANCMLRTEVAPGSENQCRFNGYLSIPGRNEVAIFKVLDMTVTVTGANATPAVTTVATLPSFPTDMSDPSYLTPNLAFGSISVKNTGNTFLRNMTVQVTGDWQRVRSTDSRSCQEAYGTLPPGRECAVFLSLKNPSVAKNYAGSLTVGYTNSGNGASGTTVFEFDKVVGK